MPGIVTTRPWSRAECVMAGAGAAFLLAGSARCTVDRFFAFDQRTIDPPCPYHSGRPGLPHPYSLIRAQSFCLIFPVDVGAELVLPQCIELSFFVVGARVRSAREPVEGAQHLNPTLHLDRRQ